MGDRGNFKLIQRKPGSNEEGAIYLYTHWGGSELPEVLQEALKRGHDRWTDEPYFARILFCELVGDNFRDTTGYGIGLYRPDNEHTIAEVDCDKQTVRFLDWQWPSNSEGKVLGEWSFSDYIVKPISELMDVFHGGES